MYAGTFASEPIESSIRSTASFAPPCSGPYSAAAAPDSELYGSVSAEPIARIAFVPAFSS
jgi:hypothetical protein